MVGKELYEVIFVAEKFPVFEIPAKSQIRSFQHEPSVGVRIRNAILVFNRLWLKGHL